MTMMNPVHAGIFVREELVEANGLTVSKVADLLGVARPNLNNVLNGHRALSYELALKFEALFPTIKADFLVRLQTNHDLAQARMREAEIKAGIKSYEMAA